MVLLENLENEPSCAPLLLHHVNEIDGDDNDIEQLFEDFGGPNEVLPYVTTLKEKGNSLFQLKDYNNASVNYKKAIKFLCVAMSATCDDLLDCANNPWFRNLIVTLTLNLAACSLKLNHFSDVVVLCSLVLEDDSKNVKALFRRGLACVKLGNFLKAYDDLKQALNLEPANKDILREISSLERVMSESDDCKDITNKQGKDMDVDDKIGVGLPNLMNKQELCSTPDKMKLEKQVECSSELSAHTDSKGMENCIAKEQQKEGLEKEPPYPCGCYVSSKVYGGDKDLKDAKPDIMESLEEQDSHSTSEFCTNCKDKQASIHGDGKQQEIFPRSSSSGFSLSDESMIYHKNENPNLAEPKYLFYNRRRQGSLLTISKTDYQLMSQGKTLKFHNASSCSFMEVRIAQMLDENSINKNGAGIQGRVCSTHVRNEPRSQEKVHSPTQFMEVSSEINSCLTEEDNQQNLYEVSSCRSGNIDQTSHTKMVPLFSFAAKPRIKTRRRKFDEKTHRSTRIQMQNNKKRKITISRKVPFIPINLGCDCRFADRRKRKCPRPPPFDIYFPPTKKLLVASSYDIVFNVCHCNPNLCTYAAGTRRFGGML